MKRTIRRRKKSIIIIRKLLNDDKEFFCILSLDLQRMMSRLKVQYVKKFLYLLSIEEGDFMKLYRFEKENGQEVHNYSSVSSFYTKIMKTVEPTNIGLMYIEKGGIIGYHEAPVAQLFIIVEGEGWIEGEDRNKIILQSGEGVLWKKGEGHSCGSDNGTTALVIQASHMNVIS